MGIQIKMHFEHFCIFLVFIIDQMYVQLSHTAENIAAVLDSVAQEPSTSTFRRAQQLRIARSSMINIMYKRKN